MTYVVMIVGPTETPTLLGPYRKRERAEQAADRWNAANPIDYDDDGEQWVGHAVAVTPFDEDEY